MARRRYGWLALGIIIVAGILMRTSLVDAYVSSKAKSSQTHETLLAADSTDVPMLGDEADEAVTQHKMLGSHIGSLQANASGTAWSEDALSLFDACSQIEARILSESGELSIAPIANELCDSSLQRQDLMARHLEISREASGGVMPSYFAPGAYGDFAGVPVMAANTSSPSFDASGGMSAIPDYYVSRGFHGAFAGGGGGGGGGKPDGNSGQTPSGPDGSTTPNAPTPNAPTPNVPGDSNPPVNSGPGSSDPVDTPPVDTTPDNGNPPVTNDPPVDTNPPTDYNPPVIYDPVDPSLPSDPPPVATVPEPETLGLLGFALLGMFFASRRRPLARSV